MLQNAYSVAKIGADTAENEKHVAEILPKNWQTRREASRARVAQRRPRPTRRTDAGVPRTPGPRIPKEANELRVFIFENE